MNRREFFTKGLIGGVAMSILDPDVPPSSLHGAVDEPVRVVLRDGAGLSGVTFKRPVHVLSQGDTRVTGCVFTLEAPDSHALVVERREST